MTDLIANVHKTQEYFLWALSKDICKDRGVTAYAPGLKEPNLNFAMQTGELDGNFEDILRKVDAFYKTLEIGWYWMLNPSRDQENIKKILHRCGYKIAENYSIFSGFVDAFPSEGFLKDLTIQEVREEKLLDWAIPLQDAFQGTEKSIKLYRKAHMCALHKHANFRHFVAYVGSEPVSAATLSLSSYGARLDDLGTKRIYQRRGFAKAMILYCIKRAKDLRYEWVCLDASDQGALLYKALGFQELCQNQFYRKER